MFFKFSNCNCTIKCVFFSTSNFHFGGIVFCSSQQIIKWIIIGLFVRRKYHFEKLEFVIMRILEIQTVGDLSTSIHSWLRYSEIVCFLIYFTGNHIIYRHILITQSLYDRTVYRAKNVIIGYQFINYYIVCVCVCVKF